MTKLLVIAHAPLASSLKAVAVHVFPDAERVLEALDVSYEASLEEVETAAREIIDRQADEVLIFTDVFGATPSNVALRLAEGGRIRVVTGVNVPMLWRVLCYSNEPLDAVVERALGGGAQGIMQIAAAKPTTKPSSTSSRTEGGIDTSRVHPPSANK